MPLALEQTITVQALVEQVLEVGPGAARRLCRDPVASQDNILQSTQFERRVVKNYLQEQGDLPATDAVHEVKVHGVSDDPAWGHLDSCSWAPQQRCWIVG